MPGGAGGFLARTPAPPRRAVPQRPSRRAVLTALPLGLAGTALATAGWSAALPLVPRRPDPRPLRRSPPRGRTRLRVVIDAGHGGRQPGAVRSWSPPEKDINLRVALAVADHLWAAGTFDVVLTRASDKTMSIRSRYGRANRVTGRRVAFLSIHSNSGGGGEGTRRGAMNIWSSRQRAPARRRSERLAACLGAALSAESFPLLTGDRLPIRKARRQGRHYVPTDPRFGSFATAKRRLGVIDHNRHPAVLIETHWLDNPTDVAAFQTDAAIARFAEAVEVALFTFWG